MKHGFVVDGVGSAGSPGIPGAPDRGDNMPLPAHVPRVAGSHMPFLHVDVVTPGSMGCHEQQLSSKFV